MQRRDRAAASPRIPPRRSIPFATIAAIGIAGALVLGSGKVASSHSEGGRALLGPSIAGNPVPGHGPAINLLRRKIGASKVSARTVE